MPRGVDCDVVCADYNTSCLSRVEDSDLRRLWRPSFPIGRPVAERISASRVSPKAPALLHRRPQREARRLAALAAAFAVELPPPCDVVCLLAPAPRSADRVDAVRAGWFGRIGPPAQHEAVWGCCVVGAVVRRCCRSGQPLRLGTTGGSCDLVLRPHPGPSPKGEGRTLGPVPGATGGCRQCRIRESNDELIAEFARCFPTGPIP